MRSMRNLWRRVTGKAHWCEECRVPFDDLSIENQLKVVRRAASHGREDALERYGVVRTKAFNKTFAFWKHEHK